MFFFFFLNTIHIRIYEFKCFVHFGLRTVLRIFGFRAQQVGDTCCRGRRIAHKRAAPTRKRSRESALCDVLHFFRDRSFRSDVRSTHVRLTADVSGGGDVRSSVRIFAFSFSIATNAARATNCIIVFSPIVKNVNRNRQRHLSAAERNANHFLVAIPAGRRSALKKVSKLSCYIFQCCLR